MNLLRVPQDEQETMLIVKAGGGLSISMDAVVDDLARIVSKGDQLVFVHGAAEHTNAVAEALGHPPEFVEGRHGMISRRTDRRTLEIFMMVYCGQLNKLWVEALQQRGVNAVGLSGLDGQIVRGKRKDKIRVRQGNRWVMIRDDWTGTVDQVNTHLLRLLLDEGFVPVLTPPALSHDNEAINVDGDRIASLVAASLKADTLLFLSDVAGLMRSFPDESTVIPSVEPDLIDQYVQLAEGRMKRKVKGAGDAIRDGVGRVVIADGRVDNPITKALDLKHGTHIG